MAPGNGGADVRVGVIGLGAIGSAVANHVRYGDGLRLVGALVRAETIVTTRQSWPDEELVTSADELAALRPDVVVECGGHAAVGAHAEQLLGHGIDLILVSTGALTDDALRNRLLVGARRAGSRLIVPAGAIAGLDGLGALSLSGLDAVRYTSRKPPLAWVGTPAEDVVDLETCTTPTEVFRGTAREAARLYPMNANLAATVALAGRGLDLTEIVLVADPTITENVGRIDAVGALGRLSVELSGPASEKNPRTSAITAYSLIRAIRERRSVLII